MVRGLLFVSRVVDILPFHGIKTIQFLFLDLIVYDVTVCCVWKQTYRSISITIKQNAFKYLVIWYHETIIGDSVCSLSQKLDIQFMGGYRISAWGSRVVFRGGGNFCTACETFQHQQLSPQNYLLKPTFLINFRHILYLSYLNIIYPISTSLAVAGSVSGGGEKGRATP